jgi:hypothetical protein
MWLFRLIRDLWYAFLTFFGFTRTLEVPSSFTVSVKEGGP